jgi:membrane-bound ClpP family serine protease
MYCSGCGNQIEFELNYCSRCGKRVSEGDSETASIAESLSSSLGYVGGGGFIAFIFVALVLVKNGISGSQLIPITFFYFAALFGICFLILRQTQFFGHKKTSRQHADASEPNLETPAYLRPVTTAQLRESGERGIGSVTEHTTKTLDEFLVERK